MSRSRLLGLIVTKWYLDGQPPLDDYVENILFRALKLGELPDLPKNAGPADFQDADSRAKARVQSENAQDAALARRHRRELHKN